LEVCGTFLGQSWETHEKIGNYGKCMGNISESYGKMRNYGTMMGNIWAKSMGALHVHRADMLETSSWAVFLGPCVVYEGDIMKDCCNKY